MTAKIPKYYPALSTWWNLTTEEEEQEGKVEARLIARQATYCEHNKEKRNCVVRIVSTAHFQADNITESFSNASFYIGVRRVQHLPLRDAQTPVHLHRLQKCSPEEKRSEGQADMRSLLVLAAVGKLL